MKKIALITNGQARYLTHEWLHGYRRYISDHNSDIDLYIFHCFGNFSQDQSYNVGEYNIFRLPRLSDFDGILLDLALIPDHELKEEVIIRARRASVPVISFLDKVPDLYFSGIDNYHAICTLMEHLITEHGCTKLNYVGGIIGNYEISSVSLPTGIRSANMASLSIRTAYTNIIMKSRQASELLLHSRTKSFFLMLLCVPTITLLPVSVLQHRKQDFLFRTTFL